MPKATIGKNKMLWRIADIKFKRLAAINALVKPQAGHGKLKSSRSKQGITKGVTRVATRNNPITPVIIKTQTA